MCYNRTVPDASEVSTGKECLLKEDVGRTFVHRSVVGPVYERHLESQLLDAPSKGSFGEMNDVDVLQC